MVGGHMSELVIRRGELKDVAGIVDVHCSELDGTWYSFKGGVREEVEGPTSLSLYERWLNGGSWMSPELCAVYINNLLLEGHIPLVAEQNGLIVGELSCFSVGKATVISMRISGLFKFIKTTSARVLELCSSKRRSTTQENAVPTT